MNLQDFRYDIPDELIARTPLEHRERSRLLVLRKETGALEHRAFADIEAFVGPGDLIVLNNTKVIKARVPARRATGGRIELLLFADAEGGGARAMVTGKIKDGEELVIGDHVLKLDHVTEGFYRVSFVAGGFDTLVDSRGRIPLPPYLGREADEADDERYQTVFGTAAGAVAAPTAALHFSRDLLAKLEIRGVQTAFITLHVGPGTFLPVKSDCIENHRMLPEYYEIGEETAQRINDTIAGGGNVLFCGTTVVRSVESASCDGRVMPGRGATSLFIYPGYRFNIVRRMLTNFHLPCSTPLLLVAALAGREHILAAYSEAVRQRYRFFSYGDAMLIL